jgi:hypothetical protein
MSPKPIENSEKENNCCVVSQTLLNSFKSAGGDTSDCYCYLVNEMRKKQRNLTSGADFRTSTLEAIFSAFLSLEHANIEP